MDLTIVDVFAEKRYAGNQLAVVHDAHDLNDLQMQDIAREMNLSETTFVVEQGDRRSSVRIFTPEWELPFAGHPTLGTAWVLASGVGSYILDLQAGPVHVEFDETCGWITPPPVSLGGELDREVAAQLIGLSRGDLDERLPPRLAEVGPEFALIGVKHLKALRRARLDERLHAECLGRGMPVQCVFVFTSEAYSSDADYAARMFFNSGGVREDPATGSANAAFGAYLRELLGSDARVVVEQGVEIKRPSRLYLRVGEVLQIGGKVQLVARGQLVD